MKTILNSVVAVTAFLAIVGATATVSSAATLSIADQNLCSNAKGGGSLVDVQQFCPRSAWARY
jgi:hypothetical protein